VLMHFKGSLVRALTSLFNEVKFELHRFSTVPCKFCVVCEVRGFSSDYGIYRVYGVLWGFMGFYGVLWSFMGFYGVLWGLRGLWDL
jgi:hypothetical protein